MNFLARTDELFCLVMEITKNRSNGIFGKTLKLLRSLRREVVFIGVAGLISRLVIVALGLSQDLLALPTIRIPFRILTRMADS